MLDIMIRKLTLLLRKSLLLVIIILTIAGAGLYLSSHRTKPSATNGLAEYLNFGSSYVFKVPKNFSVDAQSVLGAELVYSTPISAKTLEDIYSQNGLAILALDLSDHSSKAFKDYVQGTYLSDLKKNLATSDISVKFGKANGSDHAKLTVKKDGKQIRFIFLKGGQHPVSVLANSESDSFKVIEQTITDVEGSDLKNDANSIKQSAQNNLQLAVAQKSKELYSSASPELRTQTSEEQLAAALKSAASFLNQNISVSGGSYLQDTFSAALRFTPAGQDNPQPTYGSITLKKIDGQWKLQALSLPTPKQ